MAAVVVAAAAASVGVGVDHAAAAAAAAVDEELVGNGIHDPVVAEDVAEVLQDVVHLLLAEVHIVQLAVMLLLLLLHWKHLLWMLLLLLLLWLLLLMRGHLERLSQSRSLKRITAPTNPVKREYHSHAQRVSLVFFYNSYVSEIRTLDDKRTASR